MTRETKLGLVVAGSFLALVGGVVVARLKQADVPGDAGEVAVAPPTPVADTPVAPAPEPVKQNNPVSSDALANATATKMPTPDSFPAPAPVVAPPAQALEPQPQAPVAAQVPAPPPTPAPMMSPPTPAAPPAPTEFVGPPGPDPIEAVPATPVVVNPPAPIPEPQVPAPTPAPVVDKPPDAPVQAPVPDPTPAPSPVLTAPIPEMPAPPAPTAIKQTPAAEAPVAPPPLNPNVANNAGPTVTIIPASGANTGATLEAPRVPAAPPPRDQFIAPVRPALPPEPKRDSYLEEQYRWAAGDSFAAISTKFYGTPKYADALLKYNQDYPLATREIRQTPPTLAPGQVVWAPPPRILERDYANHISGLTPVGTPTSRPAVEPVPPPPGVANSGFGNAAGQLYRVRAPSESLQEIARRTLGNSAQAARVQGFNPTLSPDTRLPIPAGAVLRLPGEAKVDPADRP